MRAVFAIPGDLDAPDGGYVYARKVLPLLAKRLSIEIGLLPGGFPLPGKAALDEAAGRLAAFDAPDVVLFVDGLAFGALSAATLRALKAPLVALVHHPLGLEEGLCPSEKSHLMQTEADALALARSIVVPSPGTARELTRLFGVPDEKVVVAEPGILRGPRAPGAAPGDPLHIVSAGTLTPRKGFGVLADALNEVRDLPWRATIAGALDRSPETTALFRRKLAAFGLEDRVRLAGHLDERGLSALYSSGDIFALASFYEGYGMVFAEAMAHGLPVVASGEGAVRDTVPSPAGFVCGSGDARAIAESLRRLLSNLALRQGMAEAAWRHGQTLPDWERTADTIADVLKRAAP